MRRPRARAPRARAGRAAGCCHRRRPSVNRNPRCNCGRRWLNPSVGACPGRPRRPAPAPPGSRRPRSGRRRAPGRSRTTRRILRSARSLPSATTVSALWMLRPMPTPPPLPTATQVAPCAALSSAPRIGQSAIASLPSRIASVSRDGDATEAGSMWSRPRASGPISPRRTSSLSRRPTASRCPRPSQQMRAGSPCGATRARASSNQRSSEGVADHVEHGVLAAAQVGGIAAQADPAVRARRRAPGSAARTRRRSPAARRRARTRPRRPASAGCCRTRTRPRRGRCSATQGVAVRRAASAGRPRGSAASRVVPPSLV